MSNEAVPSDPRRRCCVEAAAQPDVVEWSRGVGRWLWRRRRLVLATGGVLLLFLVLRTAVGWVFDPPDRIPVRIVSRPVDVVFACVAAEQAGTARLLPWYPNSELQIPFTIDPATGGWSRPDTQFTSPHPVRWRHGERYAIVARQKGGEWRIAWFDGSVDRNYLLGRYLFGKREVVFDLRGREWLPLDADDVDRLGLDLADDKAFDED